MISHLTNTVTFMTNSIGESRHVGHSIIRFKSIYFYAVNSLIVQYMYTCIYLTDISNTNNSNQYTYTYMYFSNSIYNQSQSHLSSYHLCMTTISINNHSNQYIYMFIYIYITISIHNQSQSHFQFKFHFLIIFSKIYPIYILISYTPSCTNLYTHSHIHSCMLIHVYSFINSFTYTYSRILIHVYSFM